MNKFINNLMDLGLGGVLLWLMFIYILHWFVNEGFVAIEKKLNLEHTIYWYDFIWLAFIAFIFLYGIYRFK